MIKEIPKELRKQFSRAKSLLRERLIQEQSLKEARGGVAFEGQLPNLFKRLNIEDIYINGITRKIGNKTIRLIGTEAVIEQIRSLKQRASKNESKRLYIENYIKSMEVTGFTRLEREEIKNLISKISSDKLSIMIDRGIIPEIAYVYSVEGDRSSYEKVMGRIRSGIKNGVSKEEYKRIQYRKKELLKGVRTRYRVFGM